MRKNLVNAIKLPSSNRIFGHDDDSFEESVLVSLLYEAYKRKLTNKTKIIITDEYLPNDVPEEVCDSSYLKLKKSTITFAGLKDIYKRYWKSDYSPEVEEERKKMNFQDLEKQKERADAWGPFLYFGRLEKKKEELREIAKEKGINIQI